MSAKVLVENLPVGTTADEIREQFASWGAPILDVTQSEGGDPDRLTFVVKLDMDPNTARLMADRAGDWLFKGRRVLSTCRALWAERTVGINLTAYV